MAYDYKLWRWIPQAGMVESIEWLTNIIESHSRNEQRIRVRQAPRHTFEATIVITSIVEFSKIRVLLAHWQDKVWGWPCWHEAVELTAALPASSDHLDEQFGWGDFRGEGLALLYLDANHCEVVSYLMEDGSMQLAEPNVSAFPKGACIMPLRMARLAARADRKDLAVPVSRLSITVHILDNQILDAPYPEQPSECGSEEGGGGAPD